MKLLIVFLLSLVSVQAVEPASLSLAGEWKFSLQGDQQFTDVIRLPGTMSDAGLGPKNTAKADLSGPYHLYAYEGPARYEREIEIPEAWAGQRVSLFLERCRWVTTVWLDGKRIGSQDSLSVPHEYELGTALTPGRHRLSICVDNTMQHDLGRFVSALKGGTWGNLNGIIGRIELQATPPVWIDAVQVYPDAAARKAEVRVRIGNATGQGGRGQLVVGTVSREVRWGGDGALEKVTLELPDAELWDEFSPKLQTIKVKLGDDERVVRFGLRNMGVRGTQLTMNGKPIFLRGTLECSVWPLTGYPPTDAEEWRKVYQVLRAHGLNHMRFHSWCPPEAAFVAADVEGIMLQVEGPCANVVSGINAERDAFLEREYQRIVDTYGNHPSFCMMTCGNESWCADGTKDNWVAMLKRRDPRHLYCSGSGWALTPSREYSVTSKGRGIHGPGTLHDVSAVVAKDPKPTIGHEIGQWTYWPDSQEIKKWTGVMRLKNYELVHEDLERKGLADLERKYVESCGKFATLLYKEEIELLLRTPGYGGYQLLDLHDYPTQGTALIGPLDAFWDSKGFITADGFRRFSGETVPLLRMPKRTYHSDEPFVATIDIAHHGRDDLKGATPEWVITNADGGKVAAGRLPACDVPTGKPSTLGKFETSLEKVTKASKLVVSVQVGDFRNDWEIWVYPSERTSTVAPDVEVCTDWNDAKAALEKGRKVLFHAAYAEDKQAMSGRFLPVFWSPVWFKSNKLNGMGLLCDPDHALFRDFPTDLHSNWQWYHLMEHSRVFQLDETPTQFLPTVQVIDNFASNRKLGVVFEARVGKGTLLVNGINLQGVPDDAAVKAFGRSLVDYVGSDRFRPRQELGIDVLDRMFAVAK
jgi:hypothetical protein